MTPAAEGERHPLAPDRPSASPRGSRACPWCSGGSALTRTPCSSTSAATACARATTADLRRRIRRGARARPRLLDGARADDDDAPALARDHRRAASARSARCAVSTFALIIVVPGRRRSSLRGAALPPRHAAGDEGRERRRSAELALDARQRLVPRPVVGDVARDHARAGHVAASCSSRAFAPAPSTSTTRSPRGDSVRATSAPRAPAAPVTRATSVMRG